MLRSIFAVVVAYVAIFVVVFAVSTAAYLALGTDGAFQEGTYDVSGTWIALILVLDVVAALVGGFVCAAVAPRPLSVQMLAGLVVVLGLVSAVVTPGAQSDPGPRTGDVDNFDAMMKARQPTWILYTHPLLGVVGVLLGGRRAFRKAEAA